MKHPYIIIIAGPNGVGKTTFSREYLRTLEDCADFVNADEIEMAMHGSDDQMRRFDRCLRNFRELYKEISDEWTVYDASTDIPRPIERGHSGSSED